MKGLNMGLVIDTCIGKIMLRMIALKIMALSLGWCIANAVTGVIKVIGYPTRSFNLITNPVA